MTYLSDRHLVVRHKGEISEKQNLPGGTGQGTRLGMFLFIVLVTNIGSKKDQITHQLGIRQGFSPKNVEKRTN